MSIFQNVLASLDKVVADIGALRAEIQLLQPAVLQPQIPIPEVVTITTPPEVGTITTPSAGDISAFDGSVIGVTPMTVPFVMSVNSGLAGHLDAAEHNSGPAVRTMTLCDASGATLATNSSVMAMIMVGIIGQYAGTDRGVVLLNPGQDYVINVTGGLGGCIVEYHLPR